MHLFTFSASKKPRVDLDTTPTARKSRLRSATSVRKDEEEAKKMEKHEVEAKKVIDERLGNAYLQLFIYIPIFIYIYIY